MALATDNRIDELLREALDQRGVSTQVREVELFVTPEGTLVEVVLRDASALEDAQRAVREVERKLRDEGISLLPTVRALWQVVKVEKIQIPKPVGAPAEMVGTLFKGTLESGYRRQEVWVAVTPSALGVLRPLAPSDEALAELIRAFLLHRLSVGGAGHWDPIREPRQEVDENAARYLRWRPYEALKRSIDDTFSPKVGSREKQVASFVRLMNFGQGTRKIRDFRAALGDLRGPGGAYAPGERLVTSNYEMYNMLLVHEKEELERYYLQQVERAEQDFPNLKAEYPNVFN